MNHKKLIVIAGPTASGKSALAVSVAKQLETDVISADSRQIYRGMPILTAVPTMEERDGVTHHLIEQLELEEYFSASLFEEKALQLLKEIFSKSDYAVVCGGSMMYVDALCYGIDDIPTVPQDIRDATMHEAEEYGAEYMLNLLQKLDPEYYEIVDRQNLKRVIHAIEICRTAGIPYTQLRTGKRKERDFDIHRYILTAPRELLFDRINRRVDMMIANGALEEAERLYPKRHLNSLNTVGPKELFAYMDGEMDLPTAIARLQKNTRVYAKKQIRWFARNEDATFLDITDHDLTDRIISQYL